MLGDHYGIGRGVHNVIVDLVAVVAFDAETCRTALCLGQASAPSHTWDRDSAVGFVAHRESDCQNHLLDAAVVAYQNLGRVPPRFRWFTRRERHRYLNFDFGDMRVSDTF